MKKLLTILSALLLSTTFAQAHSDSQTTTPANGATVGAFETIVIRFNDPMRITVISLTGPNGALDVERETGLEPVTEFRAKPPVDLPDGGYRVEWRGLSADGHPMQGAFDFTVAD